MDEPIKDLLKFIGVIVVLIILWIVNGGYNRIVEERVNVQGVDENGQAITEQGKKPGSSTGGTQSGTQTQAATTPSSPNPNLDKIEYAQVTNKSPYFKLITLGRPYAYSEKADKEYITLQAQSDLGAYSRGINITGWTIQSTSTGRGVTIGKAVLLPTSQVIAVAGEDPIVIRAREKAYVVSGRSPIGKSFLANKCSGYFNQFHEFTPSIYSYCPALKDEKLPAGANPLKDSCLDYIESFPRCKTAIVSTLPEYLSNECQTFIIDYANYSKCVDSHKNEADFYSGEWYVYLNYSEVIWKNRREAIQLLDNNGKIVDFIGY